MEIKSKAQSTKNTFIKILIIIRQEHVKFQIRLIIYKEISRKKIEYTHKQKKNTN